MLWKGTPFSLGFLNCCVVSLPWHVDRCWSPDPAKQFNTCLTLDSHVSYPLMECYLLEDLHDTTWQNRTPSLTSLGLLLSLKLIPCWSCWVLIGCAHIAALGSLEDLSTAALFWDGRWQGCVASSRDPQGLVHPVTCGWTFSTSYFGNGL